MTRIALHILFFFSGAAALGYQLVWSKMFSTGLGHEYPAVLAILCAFMAGMALGATVIDRFVPRSTRAGLWLFGLELAIGAWAVLAVFFIPHANDFALRLIGLAPSPTRHWLIAFAVPAIALLPATAAMGATLPVMEKFLSVLAPRNSSIGSVYGANTFGAVMGTLLSPYLLMPALGLARSCWAIAALNLVAGIGAMVLSRTSPQQNADHAAALSPKFSRARIAVTLFVTGLLGIGFETAGVRVLSQVLEGTVYTYAAVLAIFLFGTAAGAVGYHRWWRGFETSRLLMNFLAFTSATCLFAVALMAQTPAIYHWARRLGDSMPAVLAAELVTSLAVFALPTFCMGVLFSHLLQLARPAFGRIGNVLACNTLGAAIAPLLAVFFLPTLGCKWSLCLMGTGYLLLIPQAPRVWQAILVGVALLTAITANLRIVDVLPGGRVADFREGVMASIAVLADTNGHRTLRVDNRFQMGGTAAANAEYRQAHLPLLLHGAPQRALFLGVGTGISFGAASLYSGLDAEGIELVPEIVQAMPFFEPQNFTARNQPQLKLHVADARRFVRGRVEQGYDVIVADLFHPYRDGAGALYTREHFAAIRQRLATNGLFCQWLPLHQLDEPTLRVIVRTFESAFPDCQAWLLRFNVEVPVVALIGWQNKPRWSPSQIESRLGEPRLDAELKRLALADSLRLFGHLLADAEDLRSFAGSVPLNTDDHPRVTFMAPRAAYRHEAKPYESLLDLLAASGTNEITDLHRFFPSDQGFAARLARYISARNVYLRGLIHDSENRREQAIDAYVESARVSPDFTTGYAQAITIATVIAKSDPARARKILEQLVEAQPGRPVAKEMLERLFPR